MAKIKFGMMMTDASGKLGGQVFAKNRGGNYVRTKGIPTNPQTTFQTAVRALFASISSGWSALTDAQRASWNTAVSSFARTDVFGDLRNPSGKALYQRLNQNLALTGQAQLTVAPSTAEIPNVQIVSVLGDVSSETLNIDTSGDSTGFEVAVYATPRLSQGTSFVKNDLRQITTIEGTGLANLDAYAAYVARFGAPVVGDNIVLGIKLVGPNGQSSPLQTAKAVISA